MDTFGYDPRWGGVDPRFDSSAAPSYEQAIEEEALRGLDRTRCDRLEIDDRRSEKERGQDNEIERLLKEDARFAADVRQKELDGEIRTQEDLRNYCKDRLSGNRMSNHEDEEF